MKPRNIGRYQIKAELNRGGMSVVYLAHDPRFGRDVAIKILPRSLQDQPSVRARFEREAHIIAALEHPAIVPVYDFGEEDGQPYLVMRHMQGGTLADLLTYGRLNLTDAARITQRIASALDEAHARNVIHRDLKPGNILFDTHGEAFLTDFGIVKLYEGEGNQATLTGSVVLGTPAYMSPEQALGKTIDRRSDVYSLGAVLYEMLTGIPPYKGPTSISIAMKHVVDPVPDVREYRPDLPDSCAAVVDKAMSKEPGDRYDTAGEMALAFSAASAGAAATEKQMPPVVVRKKPQTTSSPAVVNAADADMVTPTTEVSQPMAATGQVAPARRTRWELVAAVVAVSLLVVGGAVALLGLMARQARDTQAAATATAAAASTASPTLTLAAIVPTRPPPEPSPTAGPAPTSALDPTATPQPDRPSVPRLRVAVQEANVRGGPGTAYPILATVTGGIELTPIAVVQNGGFTWYLAALPNGGLVWISDLVVVALTPELISALPIAATVPPLPPTATPTPRPAFTPTPTPVPTLLITSTPTPTLALSPTPTTLPTPVPLPTFPPTIEPLPEPTQTLIPSPTDTATPTPNGTQAVP